MEEKMLKSIDVKFHTRHGEETVLKLRLDLNDYVQKDIAGTIYAGQFYEHELSRFMISVINAGDVVFDIGANVGYFTALAGKLTGPGGRIVSFEPNPRLWADILRHAEINGVAVDLVKKGVGDRIGTAQFRDNGEKDTNGALASDFDDPDQVSRRIEVEIDTLDNICARRPDIGTPKLIKLDIEGCELAALKGAAKLLCDGALEFVACEINEGQMRFFGATQSEIRKLMLNCGFDTYLFDKDGDMPRFVPPNVDIRMRYVSNILFARTPRLAKYWPTVTFTPAAEALTRAPATFSP